MEDYLKTTDVFLLSSHYEAQPLCVLEAMAAAMKKLYLDADLCGVMARKAASNAAAFDLSNTIDGYSGLYSSIGRKE